MSEIDNFNFEVKSRVMGEEPSFNNAKVKVFGVGGAGGNTVNRMKRMNIDGVPCRPQDSDWRKDHQKSRRRYGPRNRPQGCRRKLG